MEYAKLAEPSTSKVAACPVFEACNTGPVDDRAPAVLIVTVPAVPVTIVPKSRDVVLVIERALRMVAVVVAVADT